MGKINILTPDIYNLISAGEVVERPMSVVKELIENSIDAGADKIDIEISGGGIAEININDNGIGILPEDMKSAILPHATSKLQTADDLNTISTLGFRGEALASVSAVSELKLISKTKKDDVASMISVKGGAIGEVQPASGKNGTTVNVKNLFYNTPARLKFLKSAKSEERLVVSKIRDLAIANPEIAFSLTVDGKLLFSTDGNSLLSALHSVFDRAAMRELVPYSFCRGAFSLDGYFSKPTFSKPNRTYETVIVNGRIVNSLTVQTAVEKAYEPHMMKHCFPMFILNLILPFDSVDVNVHPAKSEVRFADNNAVFGFVFSAVRELLAKENGEYKTLGDSEYSQNGNLNANNSSFEKGTNSNVQDNISISRFSNAEFAQNSDMKSRATDAENEADHKDFANSFAAKFDYSSLHNLGKNFAPSRFNDSRASYTLNAHNNNIASDSELQNENNDIESGIFSADELTEFKIVGQLFNTYIILERADDAYFIDQHAAHERILFDELKKSLDNSYSQPMLFPYEIKINGEEYDYFKKILPSLVRLGFEVELKDDKVSFNAIPLLLADMELDDFVKRVIGDLNSEKEIKIDEILIDSLAQKACKSAIKGGDPLNKEQLAYILDVFFDKFGNLPTQCPHGRPAVIKIKKDELEKLFKRKL